MKQLLLFFLFILFILPAFGQQKNDLIIGFSLQPEFSIHQNDYAFRWEEKKEVRTPGVGIGLGVNYYLSNWIFAKAGLNLINRRFNTKVFLRQSTLPPRRRSFTRELVTVQKLSYQVLEAPLQLGLQFVDNQQISASIYGGVSLNILLAAYYNANVSKYRGLYTKFRLLGISELAGIQTIIKRSSKYNLIFGFEYAFSNEVFRDNYLFSQDEDSLAIDHHFFRIKMGVVLK